MSVSLPFFTLSEQVGERHKDPVHTPLTQSPATVHACCGEESLQVGPQEPPQSTSDSPASFTPSVQCVATQAPFPLQTTPPSAHAVPTATGAVPQVCAAALQVAI